MLFDCCRCACLFCTCFLKCLFLGSLLCLFVFVFVRVEFTVCVMFVVCVGLCSSDCLLLFSCAWLVVCVLVCLFVFCGWMFFCVLCLLYVLVCVRLIVCCCSRVLVWLFVCLFVCLFFVGGCFVLVVCFMTLYSGVFESSSIFVF